MLPSEVVTYPGTLYDYTAGSYCGVLVTEQVMRKLAKLQAKHLEDVKRLLQDNKAEVFPSGWTLYYPEGKQAHVHYVDLAYTVEERIKSALAANPPRPRFPVFIAKSMDEAGEMADARYKETGHAAA